MIRQDIIELYKNKYWNEALLRKYYKDVEEDKYNKIKNNIYQNFLDEQYFSNFIKGLDVYSSLTITDEKELNLYLYLLHTIYAQCSMSRIHKKNLEEHGFYSEYFS